MIRLKNIISNPSSDRPPHRGEIVKTRFRLLLTMQESFVAEMRNANHFALRCIRA
jgi:hypothetical protein